MAALSFPTGAQALQVTATTRRCRQCCRRSCRRTGRPVASLRLRGPRKGRHNSTEETDVYLDRQVAKPLDVFVEYNGLFPQRGSPQHTLDFGESYKATAHQQVDVHGGFGLSSAAMDHFVGVGYSVRFDL